MSTPIVIGVGGRLRAGKSEIIDRLVEHHGFAHVEMSDPLNNAMLAIDPFVPVNATPDAHGIGEHGLFARYSTIIRQVGYVEAKKNPEVRRLLQALGTEVGRDMIGESTWTDIAGRSIDAMLRSGTSVALAGVRFPNELELIRQFAGKTVWVERPGLNSDSPAAAHASENSVSGPDFDYTIVNDGTLEDLWGMADYLAAKLTAKAA